MSGTITVRGSMAVVEVVADGNVRLYKTHTPSESIMIERADIGDAVAALAVYVPEPEPPADQSQRIILTYEHLPCNTMIDVFVPTPDPTGEFIADLASSEAMGRSHPQACPRCRAPMLYVGFGFETLDESD